MKATSWPAVFFVEESIQLGVQIQLAWSWLIVCGVCQCGTNSQGGHTVHFLLVGGHHYAGVLLRSLLSDPLDQGLLNILGPRFNLVRTSLGLFSKLLGGRYTICDEGSTRSDSSPRLIQVGVIRIISHWSGWIIFSLPLSAPKTRMPESGDLPPTARTMQPCHFGTGISAR